MSKKFLTRQDENIEEYGVQITSETPSPSIQNQAYIEVPDSQIKLSTSTNNFVLSERSRTKELLLTSNNILIKDAEIFVADINTLVPIDRYSISTVFNDGLSQEFLYTKDTNSISVSLWVKIDQVFTDSSERIIFAYPKEDIDNSFKLYIKENKLFLQKNNNISYTFTQNQWLHIVAVFNDNSGLTLYVNGEEIGSTSDLTVLPNSGTFFITSKAKESKLSGGGSNSFGQLGDGDDSYLDILINQSDSVAISAGSNYSLTLKADGRVFAWGRNNLGQLGDGTTVNKSSPVPVVSESDFVAISAGGDHSLALKADGRVYAWGSSSFGQLGNGPLRSSQVTAVQVSEQSDFVAISAGGFHSLALKADGRVYAWGDNSYGQLGNGTLTTQSIPVIVSGQSDFVAISAGVFHSLALKADGRVFAWGYNFYGQLGDGTTLNKFFPVPVVSESNFVAISAGGDHSLALKADGTLFAWGYVDHAVSGGALSISLIPDQKILYYISNFYKISAGENHSLYLEAPTNWSGKISNTEIWNKNLSIDSLILYKAGYQQSTSFITYPTGLRHQYLMGDGYRYNLNFNSSNLENKNIKMILNNSDFNPVVVNFFVDNLTEKVSNVISTDNILTDYIKNNSKRIVDISSTNEIISTNYKDTNLNDPHTNKDEVGSINAVLNKKPVYSNDIPGIPVLQLSAVFDNINYYTVQTSSIPVTGNSVSVSCWVKLNPSDTTQQIFKYGDFEFYLNGTTLTLKKGTLITGTATFDLSNPANQGWNHFVATWSFAGPGTGDLFAYRNGIQVIGQTGQNDDGGFGIAPSGILYIGANPDDPSYRLIGKMSNFEFWHAKLTQSDAALLYSNGYYINPGTIVAKNLVLHYLMGDYFLDNYLKLKSLTSNNIDALATDSILFDKNDTP